MKFRLIESFDEEPMLFINTWKNYNENGADLSAYGINNIKDGWMTPDEALEFAEEHEEDEPFINDAMGLPFSVSENDNIEEVVDKLNEYDNLFDFEQEALKAYLETQNDNFDEALKCVQNGDFEFYPDLDNYTDLAYEFITQLGGIDQLDVNLGNYINVSMLRRDIEIEFDDTDLREEAEDYVRDELEIDEDSEEFNKEVDNYIDEHREEAIDNLLDGYMDMAQRGEASKDFYETYFNYEQFGRDLHYDGYAQASNGIFRAF